MFKFGVIRNYFKEIPGADAYRNDNVIAYVISQTIVKLSHDDGVTTEATSIL